MAPIPNDMPESDEEAQDIAEKKFGKRPCLWQLKAARAILAGKDVLTIAPTGAGKSYAYWLVLAFVKEGTMLVVTPLKELGAQFADELNKKGFPAINVTANNARDELYSDIAKLNYRVAIFSPESMINDSRFEELLKNRPYMRGLIQIVFDEAHVVREWGGSFRPEYMYLGPLRYLMARRVPYHLGSATLPPKAATELKSHLSLGADTEILRMDTDRKNIFLRVQRMRHPINSYRDLAPLIPKGTNTPPKKFLVFFKSRKAAQEGAEFLRARLPKDKEDYVKWVHSGMTDDFRHEEVYALAVGDTSWGDCATDAIGMGIDIPDVYQVVQYGVPDCLSTWWQRAGRAVRDLNLDGTAILLAEPSHFDDEKAKAAAAAQAAAQAAKLAEEERKKAEAEAREILRGSTSAAPNATIERETTDKNKKKRKRSTADNGTRSRKKRKSQESEDPDMSSHPKSLDFNGFEIKIERAMDDFVNAERRPGKKCRRHVACIELGNVGLRPVVDEFCCHRAGCSPRAIAHCCDLCDPDYWTFTTDEEFDSVTASRMSNPKEYTRGPKEEALWAVLDKAREEWARQEIGEYAMITPEALWPDVLLDRMVDWAHHDKLKTMDDFRKRIVWGYAEEMGPTILGLIRQNYLYSPPPKPVRKPKATPVPTSSPFCSTPRPPARPFGSSLINTALTSSGATSMSIMPTSIDASASVQGIPAHSSVTASDSSAKPRRKNAPSTCSRCHQVGHRNTNRKCPLYGKDSSENAQPPSGPAST